MSQRQIENTIPVLEISDRARSLAFYRDVLGFAREWDTGSVCSISRDGCRIMLMVQEKPGPGTVWIGLEGDAIFADVQESGAKILQQPSNKPWAREMKVFDPDRNIVWLGTDPGGTTQCP